MKSAWRSTARLIKLGGAEAECLRSSASRGSARPLCSSTQPSALRACACSARGVESEAEVAFAGLAELLGPALTAIDQIPPPQARALGGALALGPASAQDRFAIGAATL